MIDISTSAWLDDTFTSLSDHWTTESAPRTVREWTTQKRAQSIKAPPCGKTVCDDPAVIRNYESRSELKSKKVSVIAYAMCAYLLTRSHLIILLLRIKGCLPNAQESITTLLV